MFMDLHFHRVSVLCVVYFVLQVRLSYKDGSCLSRSSKLRLDRRIIIKLPHLQVQSSQIRYLSNFLKRTQFCKIITR